MALLTVDIDLKESRLAVQQARVLEALDRFLAEQAQRARPPVIRPEDIAQAFLDVRVVVERPSREAAVESGLVGESR